MSLMCVKMNIRQKLKIISIKDRWLVLKDQGYILMCIDVFLLLSMF